MFLLERPFQLLPRAARHRSFWLGLPLLLYVWTVTGPFTFDDLHLLLKAERYIDGESPSLDLFRFASTDGEWRMLRDRGTYPWWAPETRRIDLLRPIAEWSFYLDTRLFGRNAAGHRLVSLAWFALALVCIHRLYRVASNNLARAGAATFFFGISQTVTQPVTFISNRSDLLVLVGTTLAAWAYWRAGPFPIPNRQSSIVNPQSAIRNPQSANWLIAPAALGFVFALFSKETGVALAGVIVAHELLRLRGGVFGTSRTRTVIACMVFIMAAAYLAYYASTRPWHLGLPGEAGAQDSILANAPQSLLLYCAIWTIGFPISVLFQATGGQIAVVASAGAIAALVVAWHVRRSLRQTSALGGDPAAPFFILWAVMFLLPALMTSPETRVLCPATVGWTYILAGLLVPAGQSRMHDPCPSGPPHRNSQFAIPLWLRHWLLAANGAVSIACAIGIVIISNHAERQARYLLKKYVSATESPLRDGDTLVVTEAHSPLEFICAGDRLEFLTGRRDVAFVFLASPGTGAKIKRQDDHTLLLTSSARPLLATPMHRRILGANWKPRQGHMFRHRDFTAEIAAVADDGDSVTALRFCFDQSLASPRLHFYPPKLAAGDAPTIREPRTR